MAFDFIDFMNRADIRMVNQSGRAGFPEQPSAPLVVLEQASRDKLQRHRTPQYGVLSQIDISHASFAELSQEPVVRDELANMPVRNPCCSREKPWRVSSLGNIH